jgi:hypothetical protein
VSISSKLFSARFTQRGSVGNFKPNISDICHKFTNAFKDSDNQV